MQKSTGLGRTLHKRVTNYIKKCQEKILDTDRDIMYYTKGDENE